MARSGESVDAASCTAPHARAAPAWRAQWQPCGETVMQRVPTKLSYWASQPPLGKARNNEQKEPSHPPINCGRTGRTRCSEERRISMNNVTGAMRYVASRSGMGKGRSARVLTRAPAPSRPPM